MIRVLALMRYDRMGASSRLRFLQYIPHLQSRGIDVECASFFDDAYLSRIYTGQPLRFDHIAYYYLRRFWKLTISKRHDLLWIEKEALPWMPAVMEQMWLGRTPYVIDFDDAWFYRYELNPHVLVKTLLGHKLKTLVQKSAAVIAANSYLEDWARRVGAKRVVRLPTVVDLDRYPNFERPERQTFNIGWLGQPTTAPYLNSIADALQIACASRSTSLSIIGAGTSVAILNLPAEHRPWEESREVETLESFDVGIAPLGAGPWEFGKSGYKAVQYMAAGLPVVASRLGAHTEIVQDGQTGFLVEGQEEWVDALARLRGDRALRRSMGHAGRARVEERYSLQANVDHLAETIRLVCA